MAHPAQTPTLARGHGEAMKLELQAELACRYPRLFRKPGPSDLETSLDKWGVECGDGWFGLIDRIAGACESEIEKLALQGLPAEHWPRVVQIKEKIGSLRFYVRPQVSAGLREQIQTEAYEESRRTCEQCGAAKDLGPEMGGQTLCSGCEESSVSGPYYRSHLSKFS
jgi:hypothetical protein